MKAERRKTKIFVMDVLPRLHNQAGRVQTYISIILVSGFVCRTDCRIPCGFRYGRGMSDGLGRLPHLLNRKLQRLPANPQPGGSQNGARQANQGRHIASAV